MAKALRPATLARNWQMLLKGLQETQNAPQPRQAAEMVLLRLIYAAELPPPGEIVRQLRGEAGGTPAGRAPNGGGNGSDGGTTARAASAPAETGGGTVQAVSGGGATMMQEPPPPPKPAPPTPAPPTPAPPTPAQAPPAASAPAPRSLQEVVALCQERRELKLAADIRQAAHLVRFEPGRIELRLAPEAPKDLAGRLGSSLGDWTGRRWVVSVSAEAGEPTLAEQAARAEEAERQRLLAHPKVKALLDLFPEARLVAHHGGPEPAAEMESDDAEPADPVLPDETILGDPDAFEGDDEL
jgi:DNA polymerase-3 subunit gamma/tau